MGRTVDSLKRKFKELHNKCCTIDQMDGTNLNNEDDDDKEDEEDSDTIILSGSYFVRGGRGEGGR